MAAAIGIIGGSGLYEIEGFEKSEERRIETPFVRCGAPTGTTHQPTTVAKASISIPESARWK